MNPTPCTWTLLAFTRFFLALVVLFTHMFWFTEQTAYAQFFFDFGGEAAVCCFLLISGYSVGYSYKTQPEGYLKRRFLRIYPLYFFGVLAAALLMYCLPSPFKVPHFGFSPTGVKTVIANFFFGQCFVTIPLPFNGPLWSLAIEVFFYVIAPLLVRLPTSVLVVIILVSLQQFAFPIPEAFGTRYGHNTILFGWPWLTGFLFVIRGAYKTVAVLCTLGFFTILHSRLTPEPYSWITYLSTLAILFGASRIHIPLLLRKVFDFLGEMSYPLYLFHVPLAILIYYVLDYQSMTVMICLILAATVLINYLLDHWLKSVFWIPVTNYVIRKAGALRTSFASLPA